MNDDDDHCPKTRGIIWFACSVADPIFIGVIVGGKLRIGLTGAWNKYMRVLMFGVWWEP